MKTCRICGHLNHRGQVCRYPKQAVIVAGQPVERCGCEREAHVHRGSSFKRRPVMVGR